MKAANLVASAALVILAAGCSDHTKDDFVIDGLTDSESVVIVDRQAGAGEIDVDVIDYETTSYEDDSLAEPHLEVLYEGASYPEDDLTYAPEQAMADELIEEEPEALIQDDPDPDEEPAICLGEPIETTTHDVVVIDPIVVDQVVHLYDAPSFFGSVLIVSDRHRHDRRPRRTCGRRGAHTCRRPGPGHKPRPVVRGTRKLGSPLRARPRPRPTLARKIASRARARPVPAPRRDSRPSRPARKITTSKPRWISRASLDRNPRPRKATAVDTNRKEPSRPKLRKASKDSNKRSGFLSAKRPVKRVSRTVPSTRQVGKRAPAKSNRNIKGRSKAVSAAKPPVPRKLKRKPKASSRRSAKQAASRIASTASSPAALARRQPRPSVASSRGNRRGRPLVQRSVRRTPAPPTKPTPNPRRREAARQAARQAARNAVAARKAEQAKKASIRRAELASKRARRKSAAVLVARRRR